MEVGPAYKNIHWHLSSDCTHPKPELRNPSFCFFIHDSNLRKDFCPSYQNRNKHGDAKRRWGGPQKRNGAHCSVTENIFPEKNDATESTDGFRTLQSRELHSRRQRYQYCWF
jgi:hypothetical protein